MPYFDRFDICEAYLAIEWEYHVGGWLQERESNRRRREATSIQLERIQFKASPMFDGYNSLSENGKEIFQDLCMRYGFEKQRSRG